MTNPCYLVGISKDGNSDLDDFYLVVAASKNAANVLVQSALALNERAVTTAQWNDHVVNDRPWRGSDQLCGKLVWFRWPNDAQGLPLVDLKNPNPVLRTRPLLGLTVLSGLRRASETAWEDGKIYDPDDGENYRAKMSINADGSLRIRAYVLFPLFGETQIWTRVRRRTGAGYFGSGAAIQ